MRLNRLLRTLLLTLPLAAVSGCQKPAAPPPPPSPQPPPAVVTTTASATPIPARPRAKWTVLFYFAADNDLEAAEMSDLEELTEVRDSHGSLRILALVDRSPLGEPSEGYTNRAVANLPNWDRTKLLEIQPDKLIPLEDWGPTNLADPVALNRFLQIARESFPAQHYALFLINHGQSWAGICSDDSASAPDDSLHLGELAETLRKSGLSLDLLGLDACQMSSLEVYFALSPYARWIVASQESLPAQGLTYREGLQKLAAADPSMDARKLGQALLASYRNSLADQRQETGRMQLSLLRSAGRERLVKAWSALLPGLGTSIRKDWLSVAQIRSQTQNFSLQDGSEQTDGMFDLGQFLERVGQKFPQQARLSSAARAALQEVVAEQVNGPFRARASGLSFFFPREWEQLHEVPSIDYASTVGADMGGWARCLETFTRLERKLQPRPQLSDVKLVAARTRVNLQARLGNLQAVADCFTILVRDGFIVGQLPCQRDENSTYLRDFYDGHWLSLQDRPRAESIPVHLSKLDTVNPKGREALVSARCQLRRNGTHNWLDVELSFALPLTGGPARFAGARRSSGRGQVDIELHPEDEIHFVERSLEPGGEQRPGPGLLLHDPQHLTLQSRPVPRGHYQIGFLVRDVAGAPHWKTRDLDWEE